MCIVCCEDLPLASFQIKKGTCIPCKKIWTAIHRNTLDGFMVALAGNARNSSRARPDSNRTEARRTYTINSDYLKDLWESQNGQCFYTKIPMVHRVQSDFQCSIERLDPTNGYIPGNVALACIEMNNMTQWSLEKIERLFAERIDDSESYTAYTSVTFEKPERRQCAIIKRETIDDVPHRTCNDCFVMLPLTNYHKRDFRCKQCIQALPNIPYYGMMNLLENSRNDTRKRMSKNIRQVRTHEYEIDFDYMVEVFREQRGLCAYSGIPLAFGSYKVKDWIASIERLDNSKGYTKDNVCLIALEFNTSSHACMSDPENVKGSGAWSLAKFQFWEKHRAALLLGNSGLVPK